MQLSLNKYYLWFFGLFVAISVIVGVIFSVLNISGGAMTVFVPFISAMFVGERFVKEQQRVPTEGERRRLTRGSFLIFALLNLILGGAAIALISVVAPETLGLAGEALGIVLGVAAVFLVVVFTIVYLLLRWAYGGLTTKRAKKLLGAQADTFD